MILLYKVEYAFTSLQQPPLKIICDIAELAGFHTLKHKHQNLHISELI